MRSHRTMGLANRRSRIVRCCRSVAPQPLALPELRRHILDRVLRWTAAVSLVPCIAGIWLSFEGRVPGIAALDLVCWVVLASAAAARTAPFALRGAVLLGVLLAVGFGVLVGVGPYGVGLLWLL